MKVKGNLISLIELNESHLELMVKWRNDPEVSRFLFDRGKFTIEQQKKWFKKIKDDKTRVQFIIVENKNNIPIGAINLMNIDYSNLHSDWGYYIGESRYRMGGYSVEAEYLILKFAFKELKLNKVYCQTISENSKVISNHKKFGFEVDGILRQHYKLKDRYFDVTHQSILKKEFENKSSEFEILINFLSR